MLFKNSLNILVCLVLISILEKTVNGTPDKLVCYISSWAVYRQGDGKFTIDEVPPNLCTHLVYAFVTADSNGIISPADASAVQKYANLKKRNPKLKTLVAMGGWNAGSTLYSTLFSDATRRQTFAKNAVKYLKSNGFDGLDLDWEYPAQRGGATADVQNFVELCKTLRSEFNAHGYLLTAAVGATENMIRQSYDVANIAKYMDFINLMTYDFHTEGPTGHNAALYSSKAEANTADAGLNVKACVEAWIKYGAPASKLVLGMALYGRSYALQSAQQSCISTRCPTSGKGNAGPITQQSGYLGYNEICQTLRNDKNVKVLWDNEAKVPYYVAGNQWMSYDDKRSFEEKLAFIKKYNLGGGMVWSMEMDDFRGKCGAGKYPLLTVLNKHLVGSSTSNPKVLQESKILRKPNEPQTSVAEPQTPTAPEKSGKPEAPTQICTKAGFVRDLHDCAKFYQCYLADGKFIAAEFTCSSGLVFDSVASVCNYKTSVKC